MIDTLEVQTYLVISKTSFIIYLFEIEKSKTLYYQKLDSENKIDNIDLDNLDNFLNENIFKIERLIGKFIKNIYIVLETENIFDISLGLKKKNYEKKLKENFLKNLLIESKDLLQENHNKYKILHMVINKYIINNNIYFNFIKDLNTDYLCIEINFKCLHENAIFEITNILDRYHIKIDKFLDLKYINDLFLDKDIDPSQKYHQVLNGFNENEINLVPKNNNKIGFFEKFFQLFG
tara:strand:- start:686 stop:1390 length:705 start_codon:yes stop_codon:yes gene_type:complete